MGFNSIHIEEIAGRIGIIVLDRPEKRNAISIEMRREISTCLNTWKSSTVGAVIITGAGSTFSGGFDLSEFNQPELFDELFVSSSQYHRDIWNFTKPVIAAINGPALGGGFDLATLCDIRICSGNALFGHPEIKFGAPPIITPLRWIIGEGLAREVCLTGRKISASEALRMGLVSEIVDDGTLIQRATTLAEIILEAPVDTLEFTKQFFASTAGHGFEKSFYEEHDRAFREVLLPKAVSSQSKCRVFRHKVQSFSSNTFAVL
ncbi:enoyl-CoA hydratase/isomerase family protein [Sporomusa aerivorans]|uniref:enoyl-CoA hydratase/isomerase family protein n=1 Tax=Sporomusa aerivorans TaxID=204936 RepID=UPI00352ABAE7